MRARAAGARVRYSTHRSIFTQADADVHMHLKTTDDRISGHVERVRLAAGARLGFPEEEEHPCGSARATSSRDGSSRS